MAVTIALLGNPNSGKTTLFNRLTGSRQHVGNFPGVTVEKKEGELRNKEGVVVVDLPGIYSLSPYSAEEVVARDFLMKDKPDVVIDVVDVTNLQRNLYLTVQLMEMGVPTVVALNMIDEMKRQGKRIDVPLLSKRMGLPVVAISAASGQGCEELIECAMERTRKKITLPCPEMGSGVWRRSLEEIQQIVQQKCRKTGINPRFFAIRCIEGEAVVPLSVEEKMRIERILKRAEQALHTDRDAAVADMRYNFIEQACCDVVTEEKKGKKQERTLRVDAVLTHKIFGIPIFLAILLLVFYLTFAGPGKWLSDGFSACVNAAIRGLDAFLNRCSVNPAIHALLIEGMCRGVGAVLSFLPTIVLLFFLLSILEDSGYLARVAFVMDKLLQKIGLSGRSCVPLLLGFGCSVPAILATRTLATQRDRRMTILLIPFLSCSAKLPIYATFIAAFFPQNAPLVLLAMYVGGAAVGVLYSWVLKKFVFSGESTPFVMELPDYRLPGAQTVLLHVWEKARDFISKAFSVIFLSSILIWGLQSFDVRGLLVSDPSQSLLAQIGKSITPLFAPLGFGDWIPVTSLLTGLSAKEAVLSTLAVLTGMGESSALQAMLPMIFAPRSALSFLTFTLLYTPCFAAVAAARRELGSVKGTLAAVTAQCVVAWLAAFAVYHISMLFL